MSNNRNESNVLSAWICVASATAGGVGLGFAAWSHDVLGVVICAAFGLICLLVGILGFWCEGYIACEREVAAASGEATP